jgi:hypothetical protein
MNAHQRRKKAKQFWADLESATEDEKLQGMLDAAKEVASLERENAQMRAVIAEQKEVIHGLTLERNAIKQEWEKAYEIVANAATLIEILRDTLKCIVPCYIQGRFTGEIEMHRVYEALQQYELWKESK